MAVTTIPRPDEPVPAIALPALGVFVAGLALWLGSAALCLALVSLGFLLDRALRYTEKYLRSKRHVSWLIAVLAGFVLLSFVPSARANDYRLGAFGKSIVPRLVDEARASLELHVRERAQLVRIERVQSEWRRTPQNLELLGGKNVFLFLIEAYGKASPLSANGDLDYMRAEILGSQTEWAQARSVLEKGIARGVTHPGKAYLLLGKLNLGNKDRAAAKAAFTKAAQEAETRDEAKAQLAKLGKAK